MAIEIYTRDPEDPNYDPTLLETNDEIEILLSQLKMVLLTKPGDILGDPEFGVDLEGKLFDTRIDATRLKRDIMQQLYSHSPFAFKYDLRLNIKFFQGTVRDAVLVDFFIGEQKLLGVLVK